MPLPLLCPSTLTSKGDPMSVAVGCPLLFGAAWLEEDESGLELKPASSSEADVAESSSREDFGFFDLSPCTATHGLHQT